MTSEFSVYLRLGFGHIADLGAYDHILFIVALSAGYALAHWRHLLILVTAFTVGHSVTLALATLGLVVINSALVEFLIPLTILLTGVFTLIETGTSPAHLELPGQAQRVKYGLALVFGLIHGLGFSTFLRAVLGEEESITLPLFAFNVGLEVGQILILACILGVTYVVTDWMRLRRTRWTIILSAATSLAALVLLAGRTP
jgi:hypothetical protein